jgi:hypothetical protein
VQTEKRKNPRFVVSIPAEITIDSETIPVCLVDLSLGGAQFRCDSRAAHGRIRDGEQLHLRFLLPSSGGGSENLEICCTAIHRTCNEEHLRAGLRFERFYAGDIGLIAMLLSSLG